jgi:hypothetical protein
MRQAFNGMDQDERAKFIRRKLDELEKEAEKSGISSENIKRLYIRARLISEALPEVTEEKKEKEQISKKAQKILVKIEKLQKKTKSESD